MDYSAATAPFAFGKALFTLPHLLVGVGVLVAAYKGKLNPFFGVGGSIFVLAVGYVWFTDASLAVQCRRAAAVGEGTKVSGPIASVERSVSRSGQGSVRFTIGAHSVATWTSGLNNDCGFVESLGRGFHPKQGQVVEALLFQGQLIRLKVLNDA